MNPTAGLKVLSLPIDHETTDVLIGSYLSHDAAHEDYRAALACGAYLHGAIVVAKDLDGKVTVRQSDHMVREVAQGLGTLGFLTGLAVFPLVPLTTGVAAVMGGFLGEALHLLTETKVKGQATAMIPLGCAALILAYPRSSADTVQPVITRALTKVTAEGQGHHVQALRGALSGAQQQLAATAS
ncbi:MAG TPA: hypothetical protein VF825_10010 [Oryzihumus sp.]